MGLKAVVALRLPLVLRGVRPVQEETAVRADERGSSDSGRFRI